MADTPSEVTLTFDSGAFARDVLGFIERQEERLLSWGFYDGLFEPEELEELIESEGTDELRDTWELGRSEGHDLEDLLAEMERGGLLHRPEGALRAYRSRFAEGIRLMARLRQMFKPADWSSGSTLVSDIKMRLAPRRYPRRDQAVGECWQDLLPHCEKASLQEALFRALSSDDDSPSLMFARFQRRAFVHVLSKYRTSGVSGTVVSAGTGSGKTKAFYIPALLGIAAELASDPRPFTKVIAVYPRNVLLADQLREALSEAAKLRPVLERFGLRPITFGALLGDTPKERWFQPQNDGSPFDRRALRNWKPVQNGVVVPFVTSHSGKELIWRNADRLSGRTSLFLAEGTANAPAIPDGILRLTREQLQRDPPDVLFLSIEMLNREMGNSAWASTFGFDQPAEQRPRLLLLDEVHAYEGTSGAQVAWILRRWRHWTSPKSLHVVGLSATLKEARKHLGTLADIRTDAIQEFGPEASELTTEGMEYNVALRGDPGSGASLLGTTIQTGMLLARLLTPRWMPLSAAGGSASSNLYGRKVFGFTDSLDALNRWFSDFSDAEGKRLARFRMPPDIQGNAVTPLQELQMDREGQIWNLPHRLGHDLSKPLSISRCSSQDPGMTAASDFIVATASLEVGYDDPLVGAVLHHKKPISIASYIQRKGRAGRLRGTRPWTVVVLSDYGGDRWAFQNIERLFEPEVESIFLPIRNPYVLRIQASYFLIDWLGRRIGQPDPFRYLAGPDRNRDAASKAIQILKNLLKQGTEWRAFRREFERAFGSRRIVRLLSERDIDSLLWSPPRSLVLHVIPTLLRKLENSWRFADPKSAVKFEDERMNRPLPEYLPGATFSELEVSEARLVLEGAALDDPPVLPVERFLFETVPGRVSKRFATRVGETGYWLAFSEQLIGTDGRSVAPLRDLYPARVLAAVVDRTVVYQPLEAEAKHRPSHVLDTSDAAWQWESTVRPISGGTRIPVFAGRFWSQVFDECRVHLHADHDGLEVIRYARSCRYEMRMQQGGSFRGSLTFGTQSSAEAESQEAVGFTLRADGLAFRVRPEFLRTVPHMSPPELARLRVEYFLDRLQLSDELADRANTFQVDWLWRTSVSMLAATSVGKRLNLDRAAAALEGKRPQAARRVMEHVLRSQAAGGDGDGGDARRAHEIVDLWNDPEVLSVVQVLERECLWENLGEHFQGWLRRRFVATLAQALRAAAVGRRSDVAHDDLSVDVVWRADASADIYLTETNSGGLGQIEMIVNEVRRAPDLFQDGFRHSLEFCQRDHVASALTSLLDRIRDPEVGITLQSAFASVRGATGYQDLGVAKEELRSSLEHAGLPASRSFVVSTATRLLRPGSSTETDTLIALLNRAMRRARVRAGVDIDPRVFAYLCVQYRPAERRLSRTLSRLSGGIAPTKSQLYSVLQQLLVPECKESCPECLNNPNRYNFFGIPARSVALRWLDLEPRIVRVAEHPETWADEVRRHLADRARVSLLATSEELSIVGTTLQALLLEDIAVGYLLLPISIVSIKRIGEFTAITLQLKEAIHGE